MNKMSKEVIYWAPRILGILFLAFLFLFSFDVFSSEATAIETALSFLMHNIPVILLLIVFIISWNRELVGGVVFTLVGFLYSLMTMLEGIKKGVELNVISWNLAISFPAILIGILFIFGWMNKKKNL